MRLQALPHRGGLGLAHLGPVFGHGIDEVFFDIAVAQFFPGSLREAFDAEIANAHADEALHLVAEEIEHQTDLAFESLLEDDPDLEVPDHPGTFGFEKAVLGVEPFGEAREIFRIEAGLDDHFVLLFHPLAGVHEPLGNFPAVGHEEESFTLFVQTPYVVEDVKLLRQELVDRVPIPLIPAAANQTGRFMHHDDHPFVGLDTIAIDDDLVLGSDRRGEGGAGLSVYDDPTVPYQLFTTTARAEAAGTEVTVEAHVGN
jgi:hypothetical protein